MIKIEQSIIVDRPIEEVFQFMTEPANLFKWSRDTEEISQLTKGKLGIGSRFEIVSRFLGQRVPTVLEVTQYEPNRLVESKSIGGSFDLVGTTRYESSNGTTIIHTSSTVEPKGFWKVLEPILPMIIRRRSEKDYQRLKRELTKALEKAPHSIHLIDLSPPMVSLQR